MICLFQERASDILEAVYGGAVKAIPSSIRLRQHLFEILEAINLAQLEDLKKMTLRGMKSDFSGFLHLCMCLRLPHAHRYFSNTFYRVHGQGYPWSPSTCRILP
uniref:Uncharacterized protein n=1 Tax=Kalanchoe fedtschenkoi TaxID=63787 RepID=A0A7N0VL77_KALFE